ncbi:MAG: DUF2442 domain-containing protein [Oscillospiraceae bacterium]|jgi:hypothetical protein|nr:DUF2442 domain-containing protein [Oscillospiraceae bacterium]
MTSHKVQTVTPLPNYCLHVKFLEGAEKEYDVKPLIAQRDVFKPLAYVHGLFELVRVDAGGYGIVWNDDIDLSCESLYEFGTNPT